MEADHRVRVTAAPDPARRVRRFAGCVMATAAQASCPGTAREGASVKGPRCARSAAHAAHAAHRTRIGAACRQLAGRGHQPIVSPSSSHRSLFTLLILLALDAERGLGARLEPLLADRLLADLA